MNKYFKNANWIRTPNGDANECPVFYKSFNVKDSVLSAKIFISARGIYSFTINGIDPETHFLTPGCTSYESYIQYFEYDIKDYIKPKNKIEIQWANGWYLGRILHRKPEERPREQGVIASIVIKYQNGTEEIISTDETWNYGYSKLISSDIYDGTVFDATKTLRYAGKARIANNNKKSLLCRHKGELITEHERFKPIEIITTPKGEKVIDFGQNLTGFLEVKLTAKAGEKLSLSFGEVLDNDGDFYNDNYRSAKCLYDYTCCDGEQTFKPTLTFYGFRYVRINEFPNIALDPDIFTAIVVHSDIKRTGYIKTSDLMLNKLFDNIIWGQKGNYLDIPTDCPQRDERLGWTGDTEAFITAACYNFDVRKFFNKWLYDLKVAQRDNGMIPDVIPCAQVSRYGKAAWGDAVAIVPWQLYLSYGTIEPLKKLLPTIKKWIGYIQSTSKEEYLWDSEHFQYSDWLELNSEFGSYKGKSRDIVIDSAYYANTVDITRKACKLLGEDSSYYDELYQKIKTKYISRFENDLKTQSECVVTLQFGLCSNPKKVADRLAELIHKNGNAMDTGFLGTRAILRVLSENGYNELAYDLILRKEYPSWLYSVTKGATTIWEHWDGIKPDGEFWPADMNSYNHYAYGAVADWMYEYCAGIRPVEANPGFEEILFKPTPTKKLEFFEASYYSVKGLIESSWKWENGVVKYKIVTPSVATAIINGKEYKLTPGTYEF